MYMLRFAAFKLMLAETFVLGVHLEENQRITCKNRSLRFAAFKLTVMFVLGVRSSRGKSKNYIPMGI